MKYVLIITGVVSGLYLWSNVWGSIFATLPIRLKMARNGQIKKVKWSTVVVPFILSLTLIILISLLSRYYMYGSIVSCVIAFMSIPSLRKEALNNNMPDSEN